MGRRAIRTYVHPGVRKAGATVEARFATAVEQFTAQAATIRARQSRGRVHTPIREALLRAALNWGAHLLAAKAAANYIVRRGEEESVADQHIGTVRASLFQVVRGISSARRQGNARQPSIWRWRDVVVSAHAFRHPNDGYFAFEGVKRAQTRHFALLEVYMRVVEDALRTYDRIEFVRDQQYLLGRRTVVAQLRPNDLLYQALRRIQKYVNWRRSAMVLAPALESTDPVVLHIAAERLTGVHTVSARVGRSFELPRALIPNMSQPRVVRSIAEIREADDEWTRLLVEAIQSQKGLPRDLRPARSALIVPIPGTATEDRPPLVVILTDPTADYFTENDRELVESFFEEVGPLLLRSTNMSSIALHLGNPTGPPTISSAHDQDPDRLEALPELMVERTTPSLLAIDSLQVVQLRRGSVSRVVEGSVMPLSFSAVEQHAGTQRHKERPDFHLRRGLNWTKRITAGADILWSALTTRREVAVKDERGLGGRRFGNIFGPIGRADSFRSALVLPIEVDDDLAGLLIAYRLSPSEFTDIDKTLLRTVAALLGERIQFRRHVADHTRLALCVSAIATARNEARARHELVHGAKALLNADHAFLMEETEPIDDVKSIGPVAHSWKRGEMTAPSLPITKGITGEVFATGESMAVEDVSKNDFYQPMHDGKGELVPIVSELAVPVTAPLSQTAGTVKTFGVIDVFWHLRHKISAHEVEMLELLGRHAGAVLRLARSLYGAEYRGRSLEDLLGHVKHLEVAAHEEAVHEWLQRFVDPMIESDLMIVWSQRARGSDIEVRQIFGPRADEHREALQEPLQPIGWIGSVFENYRNGKRSLAIDRYDQPFGERKHVEGTTEEKHQVSIAFCLRPFLRSTTRSNRDVVWAIAVYRFSPRNFDEREKIVLSLAGGAAAGALQRIDFAANETRTFHLANVSESLYGLISDPHLERTKIITEIAKTLHDELNAHSISIVLYTNAGDQPTRHMWPPHVATGTPPARPSGLSECVRKLGRIQQFERANPPTKLIAAVQTSDFLIEHPEVAYIIAVPLIDDREFLGVLYVNLQRTSGCTPVELTFIERLARMVVQCGRIGPTLARMKAEIFERLKQISDPSFVPHEVLEVALAEVAREIQGRDSQTVELVGNLFLLNVDSSGPRLRQRACVGEASGQFPSVQSVAKGVVGQVARTGKSVLLADTREAKDYVAYFRDRMAAELAVPIVFRDSGISTPPGVAHDLIGVLNLESSSPNVFNVGHKRLLEDFVQVPISSLLHLAESHKLILQNQQKLIDSMVKDVSILFLHDLKGAIVQIGTAAAAIREKLPEVPAEELQLLLSTIQSEWDMVESTAATGFPYLTTGAYQQMKSENVLEHLTQWAEQQNPPVVVTKPAHLREFFIARAHPLLLTNVLGNLYKNSIAAKRDNGETPRVSIDCIVRSGERVGQFLDVYFRDNGRGLPVEPPDWDKLFHILKPRKERTGRWGIGLPVSRHMMQLMYGDLTIASSNPNEGTVMRLQFRLADN